MIKLGDTGAAAGRALVQIGPEAVERWVMKLKNDSDEVRLKRLKQITVSLSRQCELSQAKLNLLKDTFEVKMLHP